jgi:epsilon-lactone hydrolase
MNVISEMYDRWVAGQGQDHDDWGNVTVEPGGVDYREVDAGAPAMWVEPHGAPAGPIVVYFHGGGFVGGSLFTHRKLAGHLAKAAGLRLLLVSYPHTPEFAFPAQIDAADAAVRWVRNQGLGIAALAGDSCGANLAMNAALRHPGAGALALISPWVDLTLGGDTFETNAATDRFFTRGMVGGLVAMYLRNGENPADPQVSPLFADMAGLPPMMVQAGGGEAGLAEARALVARARDAGVAAELEVYEGQLHSFQMAAGRMAEADEAIGRMATWLRRTI